MVQEIMKHLKLYIQEGLKLGSSKINQYTEHPKDWGELRKIIEKRLEEDPNADLNDIDISAINTLEVLFDGLDPHNIKIDRWNVSHVDNMFGMFCECRNFKGNGLENWNVSKVENMSKMFHECINFTGNVLENWDVSNVNSMFSMFSNCDNFTGDISNWDVRKVKNMQSMFYNCKKFNSDLSNWNVENVLKMNYMFNGCKKFNADLSKWNTKNATDMKEMFTDTPLENHPPKWYKES